MKKEYTFAYDVDALRANVNIGSASCGAELTDEQLARVRESLKSGKYRFLEEDHRLFDVWKLAYDAAIRVEKQTEYGSEVGKLVFPIRFSYPLELLEETEDR